MVEPQEPAAGLPADSGPEDTTVLMEELIDILKLLNYERGFLSKGNKPATRGLFSVATQGQSDQFTYFTA